jgi:hypothetical protein
LGPNEWSDDESSMFCTHSRRQRGNNFLSLLFSPLCCSCVIMVLQQHIIVLIVIIIEGGEREVSSMPTHSHNKESSFHDIAIISIGYRVP